MISPTIKSHLDALVTNFNATNNAFPKLNLAAEQINSIFDQLFTEQIDMKAEDEWSRSILKLLFGAHSSWLHSYIYTSAGLNENGLMLIRRAIEFTCYLSKIMEDHKKSNLWLNRDNDDKSRKEFSNKFSIPYKYFSDKYNHLKPLIVWYDMASTFGAHGNFAMLVPKIKKDEKALELAFQDDKENIPRSTGVNVRIGALIVESIILEAKSFIKSTEQFHNSLKALNNIVTEARIEILAFDKKGKYTYGNIKAIYDSDMTEINKKFDDLKKRFGESV